ncbi:MULTISPECIES: hypothetical protein [Halorussus]|uniref:hypothetical protein n=1 Tax=Halorussus TaxID=1070314 RepID=UPI000E21A0E3|nr:MULTISPECIES: hypothetical protein [Halorussus]NHN60438.1 hypothetical protein [Halorussus sp. JP-T4]
MAEIKELEEGDRVHLETVEAVHAEDDSAEIYCRGDDHLINDTGTVIDVRDGESIIELDKQRLTYPDDDDYVSPRVRVSEGTVYPKWELVDDAPEDKWKPIPAPAAFVEEIELVEE